MLLEAHSLLNQSAEFDATLSCSSNSNAGSSTAVTVVVQLEHFY